MSNLNVNSPYDPNNTEDREGRVAIQSTQLDWFNLSTNQNPGGADGSIPYEDEIAHTPDGDFVVITRDKNNNPIPKSASRDLRMKIEAWENEGIFRNAEAFAFNKQVNVLFFDNDRMTVKISPERRFSSSYKYWAVRGVKIEKQIDASGNEVEVALPQYYTGILKSDGSGNISSNLIQTEPVYGPDGEILSVTCSGHLITKMTHGLNYIVQFFDEQGIIIDQMAFQGMSVRNMTFDISPEDAVVDIVLQSSRSFTGATEDAFSLTVGESWKNLGLRVYLIFANGQAKDVTSEWGTAGGSTGRVHIDGLATLNTSQITPENGTPHKITVTYYLSQMNVDNPLVDPDTLSIKHDYYVYVVPPINNDIVKIVPGLWMETLSEGNGTRLGLKMYSLNAYGDRKDKCVFNDISYRLRSQFIGGQDGSIDNFSAVNANDPNSIYFINSVDKGSKQIRVQVPYGTMTQEEYVINLFIPQTGLFPQFSVTKAGQTIKPVGNINTLLLREVTGNEGSRLFFGSTSSNLNAQYIDTIKQAYAFTPENGIEPIIPNYIRIRSAKNPSIWFVGTPIELNANLITGEGIAFDSYEDPNGRISNGTPVIVEFIKRDILPNNEITTFLTGMDLFFVRTA